MGRPWLVATLAILLAAAIGSIWWWRSAVPAAGTVAMRREPAGIMGTRCSLLAVTPRGAAADGERILDAAESELRRVEALFSTWIEASQMSRLNRAQAGEAVPVAGEIVQVLRLAGEVHAASAGAFDPAAGPLIDRWRSAGREGSAPSEEELRVLRAGSGWSDLELRMGEGEAVAVKRQGSLRLDLDGIAKGYGIDRALAAMLEAGAVGGMVEVGGDLRVAGPAPDGGPWPVGIRSPFANRVDGTVRLRDRAVCTSGGYARFFEIAGQRFSHILDPRTGRPAERAASVTVLADAAATADAWATALSVLGPAGLEHLPDGIDALVVTGEAGAQRTARTPGFPLITAAP